MLMNYLMINHYVITVIYLISAICDICDILESSQHLALLPVPNLNPLAILIV